MKKRKLKKLLREEKRKVAFLSDRVDYLMSVIDSFIAQEQEIEKRQERFNKRY